MNQIHLEDGVLDLAVRIAFKIANEMPKQNQQDTNPKLMPGWSAFSPTEERLLRLLLVHQALSREQIARKLDESMDGRLKGILATLVGRKVLMVTSDGYQVNISKAERPAALALLGPSDDAAEEQAGLNGSARATPAARPTPGPLPHNETAGPLSDRQIAERIAAARAAQTRANGHSTSEADGETDGADAA